VIDKDANKYHVKALFTGGYNYKGNDAVTTIEWVWAQLNARGGGSFRTKGDGETWVCNSQINSQGDNVAWYSDWSLIFQAKTNLNTDLMIFLLKCIAKNIMWFPRKIQRNSI